jgi:DNA invertase Pin-like site-specific DNA recombinase
MDTAYSYIRFSSAKQQKGTSLDRQLEIAKAYVNKKGLVLNPATYRDLGVSAFKGKNKDEGMLGAFIKAVDDGAVPRGSWLLVESFDRLSRENHKKALQLLLDLTDKEITVVTLIDEQVYNTETIESGIEKLMLALIYMSRANEESATKSRRIREAFDKKKAQGKIAVTKCPTWLELNADRTGYILKAKRAAVCKRMFDLALQGHTGRHIANVLHEDGVKPFQWGKRMTRVTVMGVLQNPATYGYRPGRLGGENHYPPLVSKAVFDKVQALFSKRKWKVSKVDDTRNLFSGLLHCNACGGRVRTRASQEYLVCNNHADFKSCSDKRHYDYDAVEKSVMYSIARESKFELLQDLSKEQSKRDHEIRLILDENRVKQDRLTQAIMDVGYTDSLSEQIKSLKFEADRLNKELLSLDAPSEDELGKMNDTFSRYWNSRHTDNDRDMRRQIKAGIQRIVRKLTCGWTDDEMPYVLIEYVSGDKVAANPIMFMADKKAKRLETKRTGVTTRKRQLARKK